MKKLEQFPGPKPKKHVFAPYGNHDTEDDYDYIESLSEQIQKLHEVEYYTLINKYWSEFKNKDLDFVCELFDVHPFTFQAAGIKLEEVRKRLAQDSFTNDL